MTQRARHQQRFLEAYPPAPLPAGWIDETEAVEQKDGPSKHAGTRYYRNETVQVIFTAMRLVPGGTMQRKIGPHPFTVCLITMTKAAGAPAFVLTPEVQQILDVFSKHLGTRAIGQEHDGWIDDKGRPTYQVLYNVYDTPKE
jgi:hypothetical protein